jgi:diguanylate cyclase (GGDEF)-like protein/PAS domain S-box-containing protein
MPTGLFDPVYLIFITALAFSLVLLFTLTGYIWPHRTTPGAKPLIWIVIALVFWTAGYLVEYLSTSLDAKLFSFNISYTGMVILPVVTLAFAALFTDNARWMTRRTIALLLIIPLITLILQWTKQFHSFMYYDIHLITDGPFLLVAKQYGPWFWVDWIYNYALVITSMIMLIHRLFRPPHLFFDQAVYVIIAALIPVAANVIYVLHLLPGPRADWTPCAFTVTAVALTFAITRHRFLDIVPVARESALEMLSEGFLILDDRERIVDLNKAMMNITGTTSDKLLGNPLPANILKQLSGNESFNYNNEAKIEITIDQAGKPCYFSVHTSPLHKSSLRNYGRIMVFHDMTERKLVEEAIKQIAYFDPLTGLPNRTLFTNRAEMAIEECKRHKRKMAIMVVDFDKFKEVNDTYGHSTGDQVLKGLSQRICSAVRKMDTVSRLGGDEFTVLLPEIAGEDLVGNIAARIIDTVSSPYIYEDHEVCITVSIGITVFPHDASDFDALIKFADVAMYTAKHSGNNCYCRYTTRGPSVNTAA